jgi:hypothetical protein
MSRNCLPDIRHAIFCRSAWQRKTGMHKACAGQLFLLPQNVSGVAAGLKYAALGNAIRLNTGIGFCFAYIWYTGQTKLKEELHCVAENISR